jgi:hypothetical protein
MKLNLSLTNEDGDTIFHYIAEVSESEASSLTVETLLLWVQNGINYKSRTDIKEVEIK